jgi:cytoskeletal protein RodZ
MGLPETSDADLDNSEGFLIESEGISLGYQEGFLALTFAVIVIIVLVSKKLTRAVVIVSLLTNFLIISTQLTLISEKSNILGKKSSGKTPKTVASAPKTVASAPKTVASAPKTVASAPKTVASAPKTVASAPKTVASAPKTVASAPKTVASAPKTVASAAQQVSQEQKTPRYPGAINLGSGDVGDIVPHAEPFEDDFVLESLDDGELMAQQALSRNDPERALAGITNRKALVERFMGEELDEAEDERWWGRHEV